MPSSSGWLVKVGTGQGPTPSFSSSPNPLPSVATPSTQPWLVLPTFHPDVLHPRAPGDHSWVSEPQASGGRTGAGSRGAVPTVDTDGTWRTTICEPDCRVLCGVQVWWSALFSWGGLGRGLDPQEDWTRSSMLHFTLHAPQAPLSRYFYQGCPQGLGGLAWIHFSRAPTLLLPHVGYCWAHRGAAAPKGGGWAAAPPGAPGWRPL